MIGCCFHDLCSDPTTLYSGVALYCSIPLVKKQLLSLGAIFGSQIMAFHYGDVGMQ